MIDEKVLHKVINDYLPCLQENDGAFLKRIYEKGLDIYLKRIMASGFVQFDRVLDAGCGFGQWSLALSLKNKEVYSVDISEKRVLFLQKLDRELSLKNMSVYQRSIDETGFEDNCFDAVYCYGTLFLTAWRESLNELHRVLKPGGLIYINANGFGWYKNLWFNEPNKTVDYDPKLHAAKSLHNTWRYQNNLPIETGIDILIQPDALKSELNNLGFNNIRMDSEGCLRAATDKNPDLTPFFQGEYMNDLGVYEIIAKKV